MSLITAKPVKSNTLIVQTIAIATLTKRRNKFAHV